jgi:hypothetical protein
MLKTRIALRLRLGALAAMCLMAAYAALASSQPKFWVIAALNQLQQPVGISEGSPGVLYSEGGSSGQFAFSISTQGSKTILAAFPSGYNIMAVPLSAANGRFYSAVGYMLNPVSVFSVSSAAHSQKLYASQPNGVELLQNLPNGTLLGIAGHTSGTETYYLVSSDLEGNLTTIYRFPSEERLPNTLVYASDGNYYGVAITGGGYVYRVTPAGVLTKLATFPANSFLRASNFVPLLQANDGNLYGVVPNGSSTGTAVFYRLTLSGEYTPLYTFPSGLGYDPTALIEGSDGNLYGSTLGASSQLIRLTKSGQYALLHTLNALTEGQCQCHLTQGSDGTIYGSAQAGAQYGGGSIFAFDVGLPKPQPYTQDFEPQSGAAGTQVRLWGHNLLSASVQFNGAAATGVYNSGPNYVWAAVPEGATTGPITVTTPGGTITTQTSFTVPQ